MLQRKAQFDELEKINRFIRASKGFWGYSEPFLDEFMEKWGVKENYLHSHEIMLLERNNILLGLYAFKKRLNEEFELDLFFVNADYIQQGIGRLMWVYAIKYAHDQGYKQFNLISDPNAEPFYKKLGATTIRTFESFPGRFVPIMNVNIENILLLRRAQTTEINSLNQLIIASRTHIGYDDENNKEFMKYFGLTKDYLESQFVFVYEKNKSVIALFGMSYIEKPKLDFLFITPPLIGKGIGRRIWNDVCRFSRSKNWADFEFITNPHALGFYLKMGAQITADFGPSENGMKVMEYTCPIKIHSYQFDTHEVNP